MGNTESLSVRGGPHRWRTGPIRSPLNLRDPRTLKYRDDAHPATVLAAAVSASPIVRLTVRTRRPGPGLVHHTDRGSPYASDEYRIALSAAGIVASMSRTGDCYDNAVAASFFATLKAEHVDHEDFATRAIGTASIGDYVERFYNVARRHSHLGYVSPIEFELRSQTAALAA